MTSTACSAGRLRFTLKPVRASKVASASGERYFSTRVVAWVEFESALDAERQASNPAAASACRRRPCMAVSAPVRGITSLELSTSLE